MATKNKNPYKAGSSYGNIFDTVRSTGRTGITRSALLEKGFTPSDITVILSPREDGISTRNGDCRGNMSAQGHIYFMDKRKKKGTEAVFTVRWRKTPLEKRVRPPKKTVTSQKTKKATVKAKAKTKVTA